MIDLKDWRMYLLIGVTSVLFTFADGVKAAFDGQDLTQLSDAQLIDLLVNTFTAAVRTGVGAVIYSVLKPRAD